MSLWNRFWDVFEMFWGVIRGVIQTSGSNLEHDLLYVWGEAIS